jgi:hypothetical protein
MTENGRIARFVKAARTLLIMQLLAALLAFALAIWAVTAVWELAAERDRLRAQLDTIQSGAPLVQEEAPIAQNPLPSGPGQTDILPIFIPVPQAPDVNMMLPDPLAVPPVANQVTEPAPGTPPALDCAADPAQPRCRPERWRPPVRQRPAPRTDPEPQQPPAETPPDPAQA